MYIGGKECWKEIVKYNKTISKIFSDDRFLFITYESLSEDWFMEFFMNDEKSFLKMFKYWKKNNPSKKTLESIRCCINKRNSTTRYYSLHDREIKYIPDYYIINIYCRSLFATNYLYTYLKEEEIFEMIDLLIYFGADVNLGGNQEHIKKLFFRTNKLNNIIKEVEAGRKIVRYINDKLDDKFEMKPLRTKLDMRKILESEEKRQRLEE